MEIPSRQTRAANVQFREGLVESVEGRFDLVLGIFFLHHIPDEALGRMLESIHNRLAPGGVFYGLDPSRHRLSGAVGRVLFPSLMRKYQTPDERELDAALVSEFFAAEGMQCETGYYDFISSPLAGLLPGWRAGYHVARTADDLLLRIPGLRRLGSNLEIVGR